MSTPIVVEQLTKRFGSFEAVRDVSFTAPGGAITALLGPSGSGKSTVLRMIAGLGGPQRRTHLARRRRAHAQERAGAARGVRLPALRVVPAHDGRAERGVRARRAKAGQGRSEGARRRAARARAAHALREAVPRPALGRAAPAGRPRASARPRPEVLLLDEPFGALDAKVRQDLRQWLDELHRELGVTSLLVTHDQEEALELANQVVVMHEGARGAGGLPERDLRRPEDPVRRRLRRFRQRAARRGRAWPRAPRRLPSPGAGHLAEGAAATAFVRPHDVQVAPKGANGHGGDGAPLAIGRVERISSLGWLARLTIRLDGDGDHTLVAHVPQAELAGATEGDLVSVDLRNPKAFDRTADEVGREVATERERALADRGRRGRHVGSGDPGRGAPVRGTGARAAGAAAPRARPAGGIAYGTVVLVLQDGKVIQVETSEKIRLK